MRHFASPAFWKLYEKLPSVVQELADKNFELLKADPKHPSLHLKKAGGYWSARVGMRYRVLGTEIDEVCYGFGLAHMLIMTRCWIKIKTPGCPNSGVLF